MLLLVLLEACSSGNSGAFIGIPRPTITLPGGGTSLTLAVGATVIVTVSENGYSGSFTALSSNTAVVTVSSSSLGAGARKRTDATGSASFTITAVSTGSATVSFSDDNGTTAGLPVNVATDAVVLTPSTLAFTATGASNAQTVRASEANYSGNFSTSTTTCNGIATISPASGTSFSVTPVAAGSCSFTIIGGGKSATLSIGVTTTTVGGS